MQEAITSFINEYGFIAIAFLLCIENIFPPIPSEVILLFGGFIFASCASDVFYAIIYATSGSVLGAVILYRAGSMFGRERLIKLVNSKAGRMLFLKESDVIKAETYFNKNRSKAVLVCRCIPMVRSLISIPAGIVHMPFIKFILLTTLGSLVWNTILIAAGAIAGNSWQTFLFWFERCSKIIMVSASAALALFLIYCKKKKNSK